MERLKEIAADPVRYLDAPSNQNDFTPARPRALSYLASFLLVVALECKQMRLSLTKVNHLCLDSKEQPGKLG